MAQAELKRSIGPVLLTLYGLGTTVGAGIYVLIGVVAGHAGYLAPWSFVLAAVMVGLSALSFCELSTRYPRSAGEAVFVRVGFGSIHFSTLVGIAVAFAGVISTATILNGASGYIGIFLNIPAWLAILGCALLLGTLAYLGIRQSTGAAALFTVIEVGGLLLIMAVAIPAIEDPMTRLPDMLPDSGANNRVAFTGVALGAVLAFYAFIGFEDMVNIAEEVRDVRRTMPIAIVMTLVLTTILYLVVVSVAVLVVKPGNLAKSDTPLALIFETAGGGSTLWIAGITIVATLNGALVQVVMASRVLFGMSRDGQLPGPFSAIHPVRKTPHLATGAVTAIVIVLAVAFPLENLAELTSVITLFVFATANAALIAMKTRHIPLEHDALIVPIWVPVIGLAVSAGFLAFNIWQKFV